MYERIVEQVASRFGLGQEKTKQLLGMLVGLIFNPKRGGPAGFLQAFRDQGLGDIVGSWLGKGPNQAISPSQLEGVLGSDAISSMSAKLGLSREAVGSAAAAMLPDAVDTLSEHGDLGISIPDKLKGWLGNVFEDLGHFGSVAAGAGAAAVGAGAATVGAGMHKVGDAAGDATRAVGAGMHRAGDAIGDTARAAGGGFGKLLPWLLIGALLIGAFLFFRGCKHEEAAMPATPPAETAAPAEPAPVAQIDSRLALTRTGDEVTYDGVVDSEATKTSIIDALNASFGADNVSGNLGADANARTPGWLAALAGFLPNFTANGATLTFEGNKIDLSGDIADADKAGLLDKLKGLFGGFSFGGLFEGFGQAVERSAEAATAALEKLAPGAFSADDLVKALNLMIIHFDTGSANISADSQAILEKAANAIKQAPADTRIEVGGHTDNTGNAASNQILSQRRAEAVKARLTELGVGADVLSSAGHGQDKPVADNGTEEGRAQNRRIEFTVQK